MFDEYNIQHFPLSSHLNNDEGNSYGKDHINDDDVDEHVNSQQIIIHHNVTEIPVNYIMVNPILLLGILICSFSLSYYAIKYLYKLKLVYDTTKNTNNIINVDGLNTLIVCEELPDNSCSVCLEIFNNEDIIKQLKCKHIFHKKCLEPWLNNNNNNCPLCRRDII
tara:strand:- start:19 stop:513 length:495 start_codon:yes stop_codon:yes gene_type:complete